MTKDKSICEFNWKAPDFELPSTNGKLFTQELAVAFKTGVSFKNTSFNAALL